MASRSDETRRTVIPNWNDFRTTSQSGELLGNNQNPINLSLFPISQYISAWKEQHNLAYAGDLLSAAIMNQQTDSAAVLEAANFIIERSDVCTTSMLKTAQLVTKQIGIKTQTGDGLSLSAKLDVILNQKSAIRERIHFLRKLIQRFQYNPIWYVELSRAYANIGLIEKADRAMEIALHLAPESRYVTRSASRLYMHMGDVDRAHHVITHNPSLKYDPWLLASEIAINSSRGRGSRFIKDGISIINSDNYSPFSITELSSAIGTKELESSRKKAKVLLAKSLVQPNDNSLSQADWLMNVDRTLGLDFRNIKKTDVNFESDARFAFLREDYENALSYSIDWIASAPFTRSSISFAAEMAYTYQHKYEEAEKILKIGLLSNPNDPAFLNNLAYAYALDNQTDKADEVILQLLPLIRDEQESKICAIATQGLIEYRKGNQEVGSALYMTAIEDAKDMGKIRLAHKAILNNIREEVRLNPRQHKAHVSEIISKLDTGNAKETEAMRSDILSIVTGD